MDKKSFKVTSFSLEDTPEVNDLLKQARVLAARDGWSFSEFVRTAISEYVQRHSPGNPQLILKHWTLGTPMPETLQHRHRWKYGEGGGAQWVECRDCGVHQE